MASFSLRTTTQGLQLLASTLNNQTVNFTTVALGSGVSGSGTDMTGLVTPVLELPIVSLSKSKNKVALTAVLQYGAIETGFTWSEVGLYATNPNGGDDILVYYSSTDKPDYIPGKNETTLNNKMLQFTIAVVNADNITITVEGNTIFATAQQLESLRSEITETFEQISEGGGEYGNTVVTLTHAKTGTVHAFSGLGDRTGLVPCQFKSTGGYTEGDTATIDGSAYTITLTGADTPETDLFVSGKSILVDVDTEGKTVNFKAGGGLTKAKLALADATEDTVFNGRTFYAGDKTLRTGRALSQVTDVAPENLFNGKKAYDNAGNLVTGEFSIGGVFKQYKVATGGQVSVGGFVKFVNEQIGISNEPSASNATSYRFITTLVREGFKALVIDDTHCLITSARYLSGVTSYYLSVVTMELDVPSISYTEYLIADSIDPDNAWDLNPSILQISQKKYLCLIAYYQVQCYIVTINSDYTLTSSKSSTTGTLCPSTFKWDEELAHDFCQLTSNTFVMSICGVNTSTQKSRNYLLCGSISGDTITFGSSTLVSSNSGTTYDGIRVSRIDNTHCLVAYMKGDNAIMAAIGTVSSNNISLGTAITLVSTSAYNVGNTTSIFITDDGAYGWINCDDTSGGNDKAMRFQLNVSNSSVTKIGTAVTSVQAKDGYLTRICNLGNGYGILVCIKSRSSSVTIFQMQMFHQVGETLTFGDAFNYQTTAPSVYTMGFDIINDDTAFLMLTGNGTEDNYNNIGTVVMVKYDCDTLSACPITPTPVYENMVDSYAVGDTIVGISMENKTAGETVDCYIAEGMDS